ncbi:hypothetical protein AALO_G00058800 [Alosa alosa]|uniref:Uncharacterized protein n=1 Tax=Alosa alosa TaxID=278164 RepID=A0AAV6H9M9_9TELE|nr:hypothetical protein AALO_G00058800 [Alosa alosa]
MKPVSHNTLVHLANLWTEDRNPFCCPSTPVANCVFVVNSSFPAILILTAVSTFGMECTFSYDNGKHTYQRTDTPGLQCEAHWSTTDNYPIASGLDFNHSLVSEVSPERISLKICMDNLTVSVDCEDENRVLANYKCECSVDCSAWGLQPAQNRGPVAIRGHWGMLVSVIVCLLGILLGVYILYKRSTIIDVGPRGGQANDEFCSV